jgi:hypothetical protein
MNTYPVSYNQNSGECLVPCPHHIRGRVLDVVMLGSAFCRETCVWHGDYGSEGYLPHIPVKGNKETP